MSLQKLKKLNLKNYQINVDVDNILWVTMNVADKGENVLDVDVLSELDTILDLVTDTPEIIGLGLLSAKNNFIMGADIGAFAHLSNPSEIAELLDSAHGVLDKLDALKIPTACGINGFCLGGGLEVALACKYRVVLNDENHKYKSSIGFPEVKLGIYPGFGGTFRSVAQLGPINAMTMMLTGRNVKPSGARASGIAHKLVDTRDKLRWEIRKAFLKKRMPKNKIGFFKNLPNVFFIRPFMVSKFKSELKKKVAENHYPAPYILIDIWAQSGGDAKKMQRLEKANFADAMLSPTARNLQRIYHISNAMKGLAKNVTDSKPVSHIHVIGAGTMGLDIAMHCVSKGYSVTLQDLNEDLLAKSMKKAKSFFKRRLKKGHLVTRACQRLIPDVNGDGLARADVVIEAVVENLEVKTKIFQQVEKTVSPDTIIATNTSAIPLEKIAAKMKDKTRLIGLHFFNPAHTLPLVEVVKSDFVDSNTLYRGAEFAKNIGKFPLVVKSSPGFLVNRVLAPYIMRALELENNGTHSKETIDLACRKFGMPMGPVELADTVGLDIMNSVAAELKFDVPADSKISKLIEAGHMGRKTGKGFYKWEKGKLLRDGAADNSADLSAIAHDVLSPLWDEAKKCLEEKIVDEKNKQHSADLIDGGIIFGTGFAPHLGGALHYQSTLAKSKS